MMRRVHIAADGEAIMNSVPSDSSTQAEVKKPIWEEVGFSNDLCARHLGESMSGGAYAEVGSQFEQVLEGLLSMGVRDQVREATVKLLHAIKQSQRIFSRRELYLSWGIANHLSRAIEEIAKMVDHCSPGDILVVPCNTGEMGLAVIKLERSGSFTVAMTTICPTANKFRVITPTAPSKLKVAGMLEVPFVPKHKAASEAFWAANLCPTNISDTALFAHIIPWLGGHSLPQLLDHNAKATTPPVTGSLIPSLWRSFLQCFKYVLQFCGVDNNRAKATRYLIKQHFLKQALGDLRQVASLTHSMKLKLHSAVRNSAAALSRNAGNFSPEELEAHAETIEAVQKRIDELPCPDDIATQPPPLLDVTTGTEKLKQLNLFPLAGCFRRIDSVEQFVGPAVEQSRFVPVNFFRLPESVKKFDEALLVLDEVLQLANRVSDQTASNAAGPYLILSMLTDVCCRVLPVPLGPKRRRQLPCLWANATIRYGQQLHCLKRLWDIAEIFTWASFAVATTQHFDSQRIVVLGVLATIADAVIRLVAIDTPSMISQHYAGRRGHAPYVVSPGKLAVQTETAIVVFPELLAARCAILDYHNEMLEIVPPSNVMWAWENGFSFCKATVSFLKHVCRQEGFHVNSIMKYFTAEAKGAHSVVAKYWQEYRLHRDIYILFKWMMAPLSKLPDCSACLKCRVPPVTIDANYGSQTLQVQYMHKVINAKAAATRFPSFALPSQHTSPHDANTEDDILHIKNLPTFSDVMGQRDAELLLSFLTAPYIRIPLVLNFFATEDRVSCLGDSSVRKILEATLFEPGAFLPSKIANVSPQEIPTSRHELLATPYGLLINELLHSPHGVTTPIIKMIKLAQEMDAGTVSNARVVDLSLFLLRVVARVESYAAFALHLIDHADHWRGAAPEVVDREGIVAARRAIRELLDTAMLPMLESWVNELNSANGGFGGGGFGGGGFGGGGFGGGGFGGGGLGGGGFGGGGLGGGGLGGGGFRIPFFDQKTQRAAEIHVHVLALQRNVRAEDVDFDFVSRILSSSSFINTRTTVGQHPCSIPETEIFDILHVTRRRIARFMYAADAGVLGRVCDSVVRVTTNTGTRTSGSAYEWALVCGDDAIGRFTRSTDEAKARGCAWRATTSADVVSQLGLPSGVVEDVVLVDDGQQDVEINIHMCTLTLKAAHLVALPHHIASNDSVTETFFKDHGSGSMQCAVIQDAEQRLWVRLVGQEHDIQLWKTADARIPLPESTSMRYFPEEVEMSTESWVVPIIGPVHRRFFTRSFWQPPIFMLMPGEKLTPAQNVCVLSAVCSRTGEKLAELVALRDHGCCNVFHFTSVGRRFFRRQVFATDVRFSYKELQPPMHDRSRPWEPWARFAASDCNNEELAPNVPEGQSVVITRHPTHPKNVSKSLETKIERRFLDGILPSALVDTHTFWQDPDDNIRGYPDQKGGGDQAHLLWIHWKESPFRALAAGEAATETCLTVYRFANKAAAPKVSEKAVLRSQQLCVHDDADDELERMRTASVDDLEDGPSNDSGLFRQATAQFAHRPNEAASIEDYNLMLVNLLYAPAGTPLHSIAHVLARIENLSNILCWTTQVDYDASTGGAVTLDLIQLPRLKLSFAVRVDSEGTMQLFSLDHAQMFVSNLRPPLIKSLIQGIPHSLLLSDANNNLSLLVPATNVVRPVIISAPLSTELVLVRCNEAWNSKRDTKYYVYPVHISTSFLFTPTLASTLYLLGLRYLHCEYTDAFRLAGTISTDVPFTNEERQNFMLMRSADRRPEAHALRCKIGLMLADAPVPHLWYLPNEAGHMVAYLSRVPLACRLSEEEELRLMQLCVVMERKIKILEEIVREFPEASTDTLSGSSMLLDASPFFGNPRQRKDLEKIKSVLALRLRQRLGIRTSKDDLRTLFHLWIDHRRFSRFPPFLQCFITNRLRFLEAEAAYVAGDPPPAVEFGVPPRGADPGWAAFDNTDPASVTLRSAQVKQRNDEGRTVTLSLAVNYFYCGAQVRAPGSCKCGSCSETCGPTNSCPCPSCERFNKANLMRLRYVPEMTTHGESSRIISYHHAFGIIMEVVGQFSNAEVDPTAVALMPWRVREATLMAPPTLFLCLYEMMTGTTKLRIGASDSARDFVSLIFPLMHEARRPECPLGHFIRWMLKTPQALSKLPKFNRMSKTPLGDRIDALFEGIVRVASAFASKSAITGYSNCNSSSASGEKMASAVEESSTMKLIIRPRPTRRTDPNVPLHETRVLQVVSNTDCATAKISPHVDSIALGVPTTKREFDAIEVAHDTFDALCGMLLGVAIPPGLLLFHSRSEQGMPLVSEALPFDLRPSPSARVTVAKSMIARLEEDMRTFATAENHTVKPRISGLSSIAEVRETLSSSEAVAALSQQLKNILANLHQLRDADQEYVDRAFIALEQAANVVPAAGSESLRLRLRRLAGQEAHLTVPFIISSISSTSAEEDWINLNPFLSRVNCAAIQNLVMLALLRANRAGHANRAAESAKDLLTLLGKAGVSHEDPARHHQYHHETVAANIAQKADALATLLATKRVYVDADRTFDPRLLLFEYTWNLVLRKRQCELIFDISSSMEHGQSVVKQMIMGAGKTTVVGPILGLMLANKKNLVIQVVPPALLDFTRSILRATFSCVVQKQIMCFVCDRAGDIDSEVVSKFKHAKENRSIVVTTPSSIKSIFLKYIEALDRIEDESRPPLADAAHDVGEIGTLLSMWRDAVLIMDEVDLLLHPLKSELNFPIGAKDDIDFAPLRWRLPVHLLDAVFWYHTGRLSVVAKESPEATAILEEIAGEIRSGLAEHALQATPHLTLLNLDFYHQRLVRPLAKWALQFLHAQHFVGLSNDEALEYIIARPSLDNSPRLNAKAASLLPEDIKMLNLAHDWLSSLLPHVMQKIDRVSFGIMNADDMRRAREEHPNMPRSRHVTAIPFIGKDLPSQSSEFAHPDVVIGLTILAYRYEGLRHTDFTDIMRDVHTAVEKEVGRFNQRRTNIMYNKWVRCSGGQVAESFTYAKQEPGAATDAQPPEESASAFLNKALTSGNDDMRVVDDEEERMPKHVLPLKLMSQANAGESGKLFRLIRRTPEVIHWYLCEHIFPEFMRHQHQKLSASGQELGGSMLFTRRIGFSGTPSDLLPYELGKCEYEPGTDGQLIHTLTDPHIMSYTVAKPGWTVRSLLDFIADASPPFHALIDTGALITGMSNLQVAQYLLKHGLPQMEGVVFLDELDRKMILVRATGRVLKLAECGIPKVKRFAFYDQVHTTGMDIDHTPNAMAVQTLGKDMTFRDFSQGAYRMRGIGHGQTVHLLITPEVHDLIERVLGGIRSESLLTNVTAWLLVNSIRSEHTQFNQLCVQTIRNVGRKQAFAALYETAKGGGFVRGNISHRASEAIKLFREAVEYGVPTWVPQPRMFSDALQDVATQNEMFIDDRGQTIVAGLLKQVRVEDEIDNPTIDVQMVQEQEEEREQEQDKEKQQEIEMEKFVDLAYSREEETQMPWNIVSLGSVSQASQFYPLREFHLFKRRSLAFPGFVSLSRNYYNPRWGGYRRLKNVVVTMEWIPCLEEVSTASAAAGDYGDVNAAEASLQLAHTFATVREHQGEAFDDSLRRHVVQVALGGVLLPDEEWGAHSVAAHSVEGLLGILRSNAFRHEQDGRHIVAISLAEAESLRRAIHVARASCTALVPGTATSLALRIACAGNVELDRTQNFCPAPTTHQQDKALQCLRFFDGDLQYCDADLLLLLRALSAAAPKLRESFFLQLLACRRRARQSWEKSPLALVFALGSPFELLHQRVVGMCMLRELSRRDLHLGDAFIAFNASGSGRLRADELWGAFHFCRLNELTAEDVLNFVDVGDSQHEGHLTYPDYLAMLTGEREIDFGDANLPTGDNAHAMHLPSVQPHGTEQLVALQRHRVEQRAREREDAQKEEENATLKLRTEMERQRLQEELTAIQTSTNPHLAGSILSYDFTAPAEPLLAKFYGKVHGMRKTSDVTLAPRPSADATFFALNDAAAIKLQPHALQLLTQNQPLQRFALTCEFRLPRLRTRRGREHRERLLQVMDNIDMQLPLFSFPSNYWTADTGALGGGGVRFGGGGGGEEEEEEEGNFVSQFAVFGGGGSNNKRLIRGEHNSGTTPFDPSLATYVYSAPDTSKTNRLMSIGSGAVFLEKRGSARIKTSAESGHVEWMEVEAPVRGWVIFNIGKRVLYTREYVTFSLTSDGQLNISVFEKDQVAALEPTAVSTAAEERAGRLSSVEDQEKQSERDAWADDVRSYGGMGTDMMNTLLGMPEMMDMMGDIGIMGNRFVESFGRDEVPGQLEGDNLDGFGNDDAAVSNDDDEADADEAGGDRDAFSDDINKLVQAVRRAKELRCGDKVTRNPEQWEGHGNEDGGPGTVGKVVKMDADGKVTVAWPNGVKGTYVWGQSGVFELLKVGNADEDATDCTREVFNSTQHIEHFRTFTAHSCTSCGASISLIPISGSEGAFACNECHYLLCKGCFAEMTHDEHTFSDMSVLYDELSQEEVVIGSKVRLLPRSAAVSEVHPAQGRLHSDHLVSQRNTVGTVMCFCGSNSIEVAFGSAGVEKAIVLLDDVAIVSHTFDEYSSTWMGAIVNELNSQTHRRELPVTTLVLNQRFNQPPLEGKFKPGQTVIVRAAAAVARGSPRIELSSVVELRPGRMYRVAARADLVSEAELEATHFAVGAKVRVRQRERYRIPIGVPSVTSGSHGVIVSCDAHAAAGYGVNDDLVFQVRFATGMRPVFVALAASDIEVVGHGVWFARLTGSAVLGGSTTDSHDDRSSDISSVGDTALPSVANASVECAFTDGVVCTEIFIGSTSYSCDLAALEITDTKTGTVIGSLRREPPEPFVQQRKKVSFDDGKWHVISVIVDGDEDVTAYCDQLSVPVSYEGPNKPNRMIEVVDEHQTITEIDDERCLVHWRSGPNSVEEGGTVRDRRDMVEKQEYIDSIGLPELLEDLEKRLRTMKPIDPLQFAIDRLEAYQFQQYLVHHEIPEVLDLMAKAALEYSRVASPAGVSCVLDCLIAALEKNEAQRYATAHELPTLLDKMAAHLLGARCPDPLQGLIDMLDVDCRERYMEESGAADALDAVARGLLAAKPSDPLSEAMLILEEHDAELYTERHDLPELLDAMGSLLLQQKPSDPLAALIDALERATAKTAWVQQRAAGNSICTALRQGLERDRIDTEYAAAKNIPAILETMTRSLLLNRPCSAAGAIDAMLEALESVEEAQYAERCRIPIVLDVIARELLTKRPGDPLEFLMNGCDLRLLCSSVGTWDYDDAAYASRTHLTSILDAMAKHMLVTKPVDPLTACIDLLVDAENARYAAEHNLPALLDGMLESALVAERRQAATRGGAHFGGGPRPPPPADPLTAMISHLRVHFPEQAGHSHSAHDSAGTGREEEERDTGLGLFGQNNDNWEFDQVRSAYRSSGEMLQLDVANDVSVLQLPPTAVPKLTARYGSEFPQRCVSHVAIHFGSAANPREVVQYQEMLQREARWTCGSCGALCSRLASACAVCGQQRLSSAAKPTSLRPKMRLATSRSKELRSLKKWLHARVKAQYQQQLETAEALL